MAACAACLCLDGTSLKPYTTVIMSTLHITYKLLLPALLLCALTSACTDTTRPPAQLTLPVVVAHAAPGEVTTDLGYRVELTSARMTWEEMAMTVDGEPHIASSWLELFSALMVPDVQAHPGHHQGGVAMGRLAGEFEIDWVKDAGRHLGDARLVEGEYSAANFTFGSTLDEGSTPLTSELTGRATREGRVVEFTIRVLAPHKRALVGAPFQAKLSAATRGELVFGLHMTDPVEGDTLFDGLDFEQLDEDHDGSVTLTPGETAHQEMYHTFRRALLSHDHYSLHLEEAP